jgi:hypothetical protein
MTNEQIEVIRNLRKERDTLRREYDMKERSLREQIFNLEKQCDHKLPDGSSAWEDHFLESHCGICHETDL